MKIIDQALEWKNIFFYAVFISKRTNRQGFCPSPPSDKNADAPNTLWLIRLIDQSLTTLWGDKFIEEAGQFVFTASVTGSKRNSKRVHVHLMVHERTMAATEGTLFLRSNEATQAQLRPESMAGYLKSMAENGAAITYMVFHQIRVLDEQYVTWKPAKPTAEVGFFGCKNWTDWTRIAVTVNISLQHVNWLTYFGCCELANEFWTEI